MQVHAAEGKPKTEYFRYIVCAQGLEGLKFEICYSSNPGALNWPKHDTGSQTTHALRLTDQPSDDRDTSGCCPLAGAGQIVVVKAQDTVSDSVTSGPAY